MRIFLTGGTGFIGSHVLKKLTDLGHEVIALRRQGSMPKIRIHNEPRWAEGQLDDDWKNELEKCDVLMHLAAQGVSPQKTSWKEAFDVNVAKSVSLLEQAVISGVKKIIVCGSCMEYGKSGENYDYIPVNAPLLPIGPYAASKAALSHAIQAMAQTNKNTLFYLLRPFNIYGEGQHESNFWPSLRKAASAGDDFPMTLGEQVRDFMDVTEVAEAFVNIMKEQEDGRNFVVKNIASGQPISIREFAEKFWNHWAAKGKLIFGALPYRDQEVMRFTPKL